MMDDENKAVINVSETGALGKQYGNKLFVDHRSWNYSIEQADTRFNVFKVAEGHPCP